MSQFSILFLTSITLLVATGCSSPEALWDDYLERLERVLEEPIPEEPTIALPTYPQKRAINQPLDDIRVSVSEAWQLNHCELFKLIGERNSILGKLSEPETKWYYEYRFLKLLPPCISDPNTSEESRVQLQDIYQQKKKTYWQSAWNASFSNDDFSNLFSLSTKPLDTATKLDILVFEDSIKKLLNWDKVENEVAVGSVLDVTKLTSSYALGGSVLQSQRLATQKLQQANIMIAAAIDKKTLCPNNFKTESLTISRNILMNVFIQKIQPWLVTISNAHRASFVVSENLLDTFSIETEAQLSVKIIKEYFFSANIININHLKTLKIHTQLWQQLFEVCDSKLMP